MLKGCKPLLRIVAVEPAFFLEEDEEDEAAEEFLGEVADGFVSLGLGFGEVFSGNGEAGATIGNALWESRSARKAA